MSMRNMNISTESKTSKSVPPFMQAVKIRTNSNAMSNQIQLNKPSHILFSNDTKENNSTSKEQILERVLVLLNGDLWSTLIKTMLESIKTKDTGIKRKCRIENSNEMHDQFEENWVWHKKKMSMKNKWGMNREPKLSNQIDKETNLKHMLDVYREWNYVSEQFNRNIDFIFDIMQTIDPQVNEEGNTVFSEPCLTKIQKELAADFRYDNEPGNPTNNYNYHFTNVWKPKLDELLKYLQNPDLSDNKDFLKDDEIELKSGTLSALSNMGNYLDNQIDTIWKCFSQHKKWKRERWEWEDYKMFKKGELEKTKIKFNVDDYKFPVLTDEKFKEFETTWEAAKQFEQRNIEMQKTIIQKGFDLLYAYVYYSRNKKTEDAQNRWNMYHETLWKQVQCAPWYIFPLRFQRDARFQMDQDWSFYDTVESIEKKWWIGRY